MSLSDNREEKSHLFFDCQGVSALQVNFRGIGEKFESDCISSAGACLTQNVR